MTRLKKCTTAARYTLRASGPHGLYLAVIGGTMQSPGQNFLSIHDKLLQDGGIQSTH
jgi:hypothetical protein